MLLEARGIEAGYGALPVLRGVDLAVAEGEMVAVLGANGAGKTTLNRTLSGLLRPAAGTIHFDGQAITAADPADIVAAGLIHVPEGRRSFPNLTVEENLLLGAYRRGRATRAQRLAEVYETFPRLVERRRQRAATLSGGEQQMLAIGRGLMANPRLLILDEPSLGLSPRLVDELFDLIGTFTRSGTAILLVEQNVVRSLALAARAYVLEGGRFVLSGPAADLARRSRAQALLPWNLIRHDRPFPRARRTRHRGRARLLRRLLRADDRARGVFRRLCLRRFACLCAPGPAGHRVSRPDRGRRRGGRHRATGSRSR